MTAAPSGVRAAAAVKTAVNRLGGAFTLDPGMHAAGAAAGYPDWSFSLAGRAGVLGDVSVDVVTAALVFHPREHVARAWDAARRVGPPSAVARTFAGACHDWGRAHLAGVAGLDALGPLVERAVAAADAAGLVLFAGWRDQPLPADLPGRVAHGLQVLREHRTGLHALVALAEGLSPLEAIVAAPHGETTAASFGWSPPFPDQVGERLRGRWEAVEQRTDRLVGRAYAAALPPTELARLAELLPIALDVVYPPEEAAVE